MKAAAKLSTTQSSFNGNLPPPGSSPSDTAEFLGIIRRIIADLERDEHRRISLADNRQWASIVPSLTDNFLARFSFNDGAWHAMREKVQLVDSSLYAIRLILCRVEGVFNGGVGLAEKLFSALLTLCHVLDRWMDTEILKDDDLPTPSVLRHNASKVTVQVLRYLGGPISISPTAPASEVPMWNVLRSILEELLAMSRDLTRPSMSLPYPCVIAPFENPRFQPVDAEAPPPSKKQPVKLVLTNINEVPQFLSLLVEFLVGTIHPPVLNEWFVYDLQQRALESVQQMFEYCLSPSIPSSLAIRSQAIAKILSSLPFSVIQGRAAPLANLPFRLLRQRLLHNSAAGWETVDNYFLSLEEVPPLSRADVLEVLKVIQEGNVQEPGGQITECQIIAVSYLQASLKNMDSWVINSLRDSILTANLGDKQLTIAEIITQRTSTASASVNPTGPPDSMPWREELQRLTQELIHPMVLDWMDDDDDERFAQRTLDEIVSRYEQPLFDSGAEARSLTLDALLKLCDLLHRCQRVSDSDNFLSTIPFCLALSSRFLKGPEAEVVVQVRKKVFLVMKSAIKLHALDGPDNTLQPIARIIFCNITDTDRAVRLSTGQALVSLLGLLGEPDTDVWRRVDPFFAHLYGLMEVAKTVVKESVLMIVGDMAKNNLLHSNIMGQALCFLVAQLGLANPVLKGSAYMQILGSAKYHRKATPYPLLLPYMDKIAPFLVTRMCTQPSLLLESCRLMSVTPTDFLTITLSRTLPSVFAGCDQKVLEAMSKELQSSPSALLVKHCHDVLAHVFLLSTPDQTNDVLRFITRTLTAATRNTTINIQSVVKSCVIPLLAELVTVLGDEDEGTAQRALSALNKIERVLAVNPGKSRSIPPPDLGGFLKSYVLGLISHINDMLQDVQGKKPVSVKRKILRSLGVLVSQIGSSVVSVVPQIMATFHTMVGIPELAEVTLSSWHQFLVTLSAEEIGPHIGSTSAAFVTSWPVFTPAARDLAKESLKYIIMEKGPSLERYLDDIVDLSTIPELRPLYTHLQSLQGNLTPLNRLELILERASTENYALTTQSLRELKQFMLNDHRDVTRNLASGDIFDPLVGKILSTLLTAAAKEADEGEPLRLLALECLAILGAVDPDRCEVGAKDSGMIVYQNFTDEEESVAFALHLINDLLVGAFRSTSDIKYQSHLAYTIQELLQYCQFTPALVAPGRSSVPVKIRKRWSHLPKHVLETVTPLLEARYTLNQTSSPQLPHPIYPRQMTYREWIQIWTNDLISKVTGSTASRIFGVFRSAVKNKDVSVAHCLLPHLVLNVLLSGNEDSTQQIRAELLAVLDDQIDFGSNSTSDKKLLSAQAVFMLLDHLNRWIRKIRKDIAIHKDQKRIRAMEELGEELMKVESVLMSIDQGLMAKAALQCKAYARALMSFESQILTLRDRNPDHEDLPLYYERLHEIYAHLDEPDGMEGISTMILSPSLEHQIRHHETSGHWTSAQSCWEVRLQQSPDNVDFHLGLLRCLRNLGHYDTLRTHVRGVLTRNPGWQPALAGFQIESAWMVGAWDDVQNIIESMDPQTPQAAIARILLAMRSHDSEIIAKALRDARLVLGGPVAAAGIKEYRRSYDAALNLHLTHDLEIIYNIVSSFTSQTNSQKQNTLAELSALLSTRLDSTLPTFRTREPILSMRRTAFALIDMPATRSLNKEIGRSWLASAKIARKAGQWQTAYSAALQSEQSRARYSSMESAKLLKATGEPLRALQQLENSMRVLGFLEDSDIVDLSEDEEEKKFRGKMQLLRARWMSESQRFEASIVYKAFNKITILLPKWESAQYYLGQFQDECFKSLPPPERVNRRLKMNFYTVQAYAFAINLGSKYVYQTVPRLLTLWLDLGEDSRYNGSDLYHKLNEAVAKAIQAAPVYKWFTAFPQIVSRIGHSNPEVYKHLARLIAKVIHTYPNQALWLFTSVSKSQQPSREQRGKLILDRLRSNPNLATGQVPKLIDESIHMTNELLNLCDYEVGDKEHLKMSRNFPALNQLGHSRLIIPLQESLTASLPPTLASESTHQPFPSDAPTFASFAEEVEVMRSLAKPRKITIHGSNGQTYMFLGKPKDDLRKDARLMDFNAIINKLLKANSESRRRQLHIRTYGVVTLNEECGFIQWVPNTRPVRPVLAQLYDARQVRTWTSDMLDIFTEIKRLDDANAAALFRSKVMYKYAPVFHEWFIETFPEPSAWLASRLTYARTSAVMCMVGFILGLGDRHGENILLDENTGDLIHVDFNCLFEKGKNLETPERVPFRLTHNLVDGLGVSGVEGVFRTACELSLKLLRDNKDPLMSVLDAFIHDPLVEWANDSRKMEKKLKHAAGDPNKKNAVKSSTDLAKLAKNALGQIERKLRGVYSTAKEKHTYEKEVSTSNLVQLLIQEATDIHNLAKMYPGWTAWH